MAEAARELLLFLLLFVVGNIFCAEVVYVETGKNYTFKSSATGTPETILWKYKKNKVVEYENNDFTWYRFKGRSGLDTKTGDFTLKQLNKEDSGQYESEIQVNGKLQYSDHEIEVMDAVPVPEVTCHANSTEATLQCSVGSSVQAKLSWKGPNGFEETGERISAPLKEQSVYICTAQNEVGEKSTEFYLTKCNTDGSGVPLAAILVPLLAIGCGVTVGIFLWHRRKQRNYETVKAVEVEIGERSNGDLSAKGPDHQGDESKKSTDEHMKIDELHPAESSSQQNEDRKSQEAFLKPESNSVENNKPSEEEEQIPEKKDLTEGNQENEDAEPQTQDSDEKGQSEEQSVAEEDKEKKEQQDDIMDERASTTLLFNGEKSPPAEPTDLEETQPENKDDCSGSMEGIGNYSEEKQENAGQNPEESPFAAANGPENAQTDNNSEPSSSMADKDESVKKESDQAAGRVGKTVKEFERRVWKPREISRKSNQENGNI